jgi:signal peptidase I
MWPFLRDGDTVTVKPCSRDARTGDIVVYFAGEVLLIHRVVKAKRTPAGTVLRTKGDFALSLDPAAVTEADLIGKAVAVQRGKAHIDLESATAKVCGSLVAALSYSIGLTLGRLLAALRTSR